MNPENKNINTDLIGKYLAGEASPEEAMLLEEWLTDPENEKAFDQYTKVWNLMPASVTPEIPSTQQEWSQVQAKINKPHKPAPIRQMLRKLAVAASIVVLILSVYYFYERNRSETIIPEVDQAWVTYAAKDERRVDTLKDGSIITINKSSSIDQSADYNNVTREVKLEGEAFFQVMPDKAKPFIIAMDDLKVEVVGTSFNIRNLPLTDEIEVQVKTGIVKMTANENSLVVKKDQSGIYKKSSHSLSLKDTIDINSLGYATNSFYFNDVPLTDACKYLSQAFDVDIEVDAIKFGDCRLTAEFDNKTLTYILDVINATFNTTYHQKGNTYSINGSGCQ